MKFLPGLFLLTACVSAQAVCFGSGIQTCTPDSRPPIRPDGVGAVCLINESGHSSAGTAAAYQNSLAAVGVKWGNDPAANTIPGLKKYIAEQESVVKSFMGGIDTAIAGIQGAYVARGVVRDAAEPFSWAHLATGSSDCKIYPAGTSIGYYAQIQRNGWHHICDGNVIVGGKQMVRISLGGTWTGSPSCGVLYVN